MLEDGDPEEAEADATGEHVGESKHSQGVEVRHGGLPWHGRQPSAMTERARGPRRGDRQDCV